MPPLILLLSPTRVPAVRLPRGTLSRLPVALCQAVGVPPDYARPWHTRAQSTWKGSGFAAGCTGEVTCKPPSTWSAQGQVLYTCLQDSFQDEEQSRRTKPKIKDEEHLFGYISFTCYVWLLTRMHPLDPPRVPRIIHAKYSTVMPTSP